MADVFKPKYLDALSMAKISICIFKCITNCPKWTNNPRLLKMIESFYRISKIVDLFYTAVYHKRELLIFLRFLRRLRQLCQIHFVFSTAAYRSKIIRRRCPFRRKLFATPVMIVSFQIVRFILHSYSVSGNFRIIP